MSRFTGIGYDMNPDAPAFGESVWSAEGGVCDSPLRKRGLKAGKGDVDDKYRSVLIKLGLDKYKFLIL